MTAGMPFNAPLSVSTPAMPRKSEPGNTRCWCPSKIASTPSTADSAKAAFSSPGEGVLREMPEWQSAITISAAVAAQLGYMSPRRLDDADGRRAARQMALIPLDDLGRDETDHANPQQARDAVFVLHRTVENHPGFEVGAAVRA